MVIRDILGRFWDILYFQLFLGTPCIDMPKKCHSSTQKSKPRPGACLEEASVDQWETRFELADPWLVQTYFFKVSSGPGLWLLWSTMQLFRLIYTGCPQKWLKTTGCPKSTQPTLEWLYPLAWKVSKSITKCRQTEWQIEKWTNGQMQCTWPN